MARSHPLSFQKEAAKAGVTSMVPRGLQTIRVRRIVGSAGKAKKLDARFRPLGRGPAEKTYAAILRRMQGGEVLPPIAVYQLGYRYFVIDGHTRVAVAKALGVEFIDATVTEALPRKEGEANLTYYARREFEEHTGLRSVRLTAPWRYQRLEQHVEGYRLYLEHSWGREVSLLEGARIWYRTQYLPTLLEIRRRKLGSDSGGRTAGDVYTDILRAWAEAKGRPVSLREMLDRYDQSLRQEQGPVARARRLAAGLVDASLPKAIPSIGAPRRSTFEEEDVEEDLRGGHEPGGNG